MITVRTRSRSSKAWKPSGSDPRCTSGRPVRRVCTISFNAQYVLDFLNVVETDVVSLSLKDEVSQAVMKPVGADGYDYTYVIMPMRI